MIGKPFTRRELRDLYRGLARAYERAGRTDEAAVARATAKLYA